MYEKACIHEKRPIQETYLICVVISGVTMWIGAHVLLVVGPEALQMCKCVKKDVCTRKETSTKETYLRDIHNLRDIHERTICTSLFSHVCLFSRIYVSFLACMSLFSHICLFSRMYVCFVTCMSPPQKRHT